MSEPSTRILHEAGKRREAPRCHGKLFFRRAELFASKGVFQEKEKKKTKKKKTLLAETLRQLALAFLPLGLTRPNPNPGLLRCAAADFLARQAREGPDLASPSRGARARKKARTALRWRWCWRR